MAHISDLKSIHDRERKLEVGKGQRGNYELCKLMGKFLLTSAVPYKHELWSERYRSSWVSPGTWKVVGSSPKIKNIKKWSSKMARWVELPSLVTRVWSPEPKEGGNRAPKLYSNQHVCYRAYVVSCSPFFFKKDNTRKQKKMCFSNSIHFKNPRCWWIQLPKEFLFVIAKYLGYLNVALWLNT